MHAVAVGAVGGIHRARVTGVLHPVTVEVGLGGARVRCDRRELRLQQLVVLGLEELGGEVDGASGEGLGAILHAEPRVERVVGEVPGDLREVALGVELEVRRRRDREEVEAALAGNGPFRSPPRHAIAHHLMQWWVNK